MDKYFALTSPSCPRDVSILCAADEGSDTAAVHFDVLNGAWSGTFYPDRNELKLDIDDTVMPALKVWAGTKLRGREYNEQIANIELEIRGA